MIISRFNEDLKWTEMEPFVGVPTIIYNKGTNDNFCMTESNLRVERLPNLGREGHTYLHHIVSNYDSLADITVFLPGSAEHPYKMPTAENLVREVRLRDRAVFARTFHRVQGIGHAFSTFELESYVITDARNLAANPDSTLTPAFSRPFGRWFRNHFGRRVVQPFVLMGIFSVARADVLRHPRSYYEGFLRELCVPNPEAGHFIERAWTAIFHPLKETLLLEGWDNRKFIPRVLRSRISKL